MAVTQADIDVTIEALQGTTFHWLNAAAEQDTFGNWETAQCFLDKAEDAALRVGVLQTKCDRDISEFVNENAAAAQCDLENDRGIGEWAIPPGDVRCGIFKIRRGITPPPYGEFRRTEFVTNHFTEEVTE